MKKFYVLVLCLLTWGVVIAQKTISGAVTHDNTPLPGVSVIIKGSHTGTVTDINGNYTISAPDNTILIFTFPGMQTQEVAVKDKTSINVSLHPIELEEIVVTALGITREEKTLGYAMQSVSAEEIEKANTENMIDALSGKAAGLLITSSSGAAGSPTRVVLRGQTSFNGNNEALLVVDGVRVDNSENHTERSLGGVANSNRAIDIDPDDIESVSVLKGGAATALYGIEGARGVILITTKKGKKGEKMNIELSSNYTLSEVSNTLDLQNKYAQGTKGIWVGPDGNDNKKLKSGRPLSWGPALDNLYWDGSNYTWDKNGRIVVGNSTGNLRKVTPYNNVDDFFQTGHTLSTNLAISGGPEDLTYRITLGNVEEKGITPKNKFRRFNAGLALGTSFLDGKLNIQGSARFTRSSGRRIQQGSNISGVMLGLLRTPITFDNSNGFSNPEDEPLAYQLPLNSQRNYRGGDGYDNPYWVVNNTPFRDYVDRYLGNITASYSFNPWVTVSTTIGTDYYTDHRVQEFEIGSRAFPEGQVIEDEHIYKHVDAYFKVYGGGNILSDFSFNYNVGVNLWSKKYKQVFVQGDQLNFFGFRSLNNTVEKSTEVDHDNEKTFGIFGSFDFGYKDFLFLTLTARNDWNSTLIDPYKKFSSSDISFFYPSVSSGFVFSELINDFEALNFAKLRVSYAEVGGGAPEPYQTQTTYVPPISDGTVNDLNDGWTNGIIFPFLSTAGFTYNAVQGNPNLDPSKTIDKEIGLELKFFNNRLGFDFAYYVRNSKDQIIAVNIPASTGHQRAVINSGELKTKGGEIVLNVVPIRKNDLEWTMTANFSKWKTKVKSLPEGVPNQFLDGFTGTAIYNVAPDKTTGKEYEYGLLLGGAFQRVNSTDANGNPIYDPDKPFNSNGALIIDDSGSPDIASSDYNRNYGFPLADPITNRVIGNPNPDFLLGINNSIRYKNWNLSFLIDIKRGGDMWNGTKGALTFFGRTENTANRDPVFWDDIHSPKKGAYGDYATATHVFEGVKKSNSSVNDIKVPLTENWYTGNGGGFGSVSEHFVEDASYYRLRTITLSYSFKDLIKTNLVSDIIVAFTGRNLILITPYSGIDPETSLVGSSSNGQGLDYFQLPGTRSYAFGVKVKF